MPIKSKLPTLAPATERLKKTIELISGGYSLQPEIKNGMLTIYPWDSEVSQWAIDATNNSGRDNYDFSARVVQRLTRLSDALLERFIASELLLIMLVARSLVSDSVLRYTSTCPHCGTKQVESKIKVPDNLGVVGKKPTDYVGYDTITLPATGDELRVRPIQIGDVRRIAEVAGSLSESGMLNAGSVVSVNGGTPDRPREAIEYYLALPPADVDFLQKYLRDNSPALDTAVPHICDNERCKKPFKFNLGLHYDFFL